MVLAFLKLLCLFLIALSLVIITIQAKAKFDRSFLIFGVANILLCFFSAFDLWLIPGPHALFFTRIQHVVACLFAPFLIWHFHLLTEIGRFKIVILSFFVSFSYIPFFFTNVFFLETPDLIRGTLYYQIFFAPYLLLCLVYLFGLLISRLSDAKGPQRQAILLHLCGFIFLAAGGILDLIVALWGKRFFWNIPSTSIIGILGFSMTASTAFINKLTQIITDREIFSRKLQNAYSELEDAQELKEIGLSAAKMSHEIKNYASSILLPATYILKRETLGEKSVKHMNTIIETTNRLVSFSKEVLDFSRTEIIKDATDLNLRETINFCIEKFFSGQINAFQYDPSGEPVVIKGDVSKLEQVFFNLFKNSFEAGASSVKVEVINKPDLLLCCIEDNGMGCSEKDLGQLFKSFYTTKKSSGGTGLGMCVVRSIVEKHGGRIGAYTKNVLGENKKGMIFLVSISKCVKSEDSDWNKGKVIIITDGINKPEIITRICQNVNCETTLISDTKALNSKLVSDQQNSVVCVAGEKVRELPTIGNLLICSLIEKEDMFLVAIGNSDNYDIFNEKFVLTQFN